MFCPPQVIYELRDEAGDLYYFNGFTGVSSWEPPEWVDSLDPASGACYYENTLSGETQVRVLFFNRSLQRAVRRFPHVLTK